MRKTYESSMLGKGMSISEEQLTTDVIGENTSNPLRFGFVKKTSAHAGGHS